MKGAFLVLLLVSALFELAVSFFVASLLLSLFKWLFFGVLASALGITESRLVFVVAVGLVEVLELSEGGAA